MGGFYGSIHVRADSNQSIKEILVTASKKKRHKFYLAPPINGWISIFPDGSGQDKRVSQYLAKNLDHDIVHLLVHDDDIFCYWYYRKGNLVDEYNSCPDYFGGFVSHKRREKFKGNPDVFKDLVSDNTKLLEIRKLLEKGSSAIKNIADEKNIIEKFKPIQSKLNEIKKIINNQDSTLRFIKENPNILKAKMESMVQQAKNKGLETKEEILKDATKPGNLQEIMGTILTGLFESSGIPDDLKKMVNESSEDIKNVRDINNNPPDGLFASDTMSKFADLLDIPNAVTSYEYLDSGEIESILEWDRFIKLC